MPIHLTAKPSCLKVMNVFLKHRNDEMQQPQQQQQRRFANTSTNRYIYTYINIYSHCIRFIYIWYCRHSLRSSRSTLHSGFLTSQSTLTWNKENNESSMLSKILNLMEKQQDQIERIERNLQN